MSGGRYATLAAGLDDLGCAALLVLAASAADSDLAPFLAAPLHLGAAFLVAPRGGVPRLAYLTAMERDEAAAAGLALLSPADLEQPRALAEEAAPAGYLARLIGAALEKSGVAPGRVALAGHGAAGEVVGACAALARLGWEWVPGNELAALLRKGKTAPELAALRRAAGVTVAALRAVAGSLAAAVPEAPSSQWLCLGGERLTVARLRAEAAAVLTAGGLEQPRGNIVAPGDEGGVPHSSGSDERALRRGEGLVVDLFPRGAWRDLPPLFADCTRTLCAGEPAAELRRAHAEVLAALEMARALAVAGARGWDLQEAVCLRFEAAGYETPLHHPGTTRGYVHNLGHGVGHELHELPIFRHVAGAEGVLAPGDVFTLEPGLYDAAAGWGVRLEDLCHLGAGGLEVLTPLPYDLDPRCYAR